jgi:spermidine/putrescine transport system substrate-binding protein
MKLARAAAVIAISLAAAACGGDSGGAAAAKTLHIFTWSDYLAPEIKSDFEKEFGCTVVESNFENNEELRAKLQVSNEGYDLVCPSDYAVTSLVKDGLLLEIDHARVPNLKHLGAAFASPSYDRGLKYSVPFQWGVTGIGFSKNATAAAGAPASWADFFDSAKLTAWKGRVSCLDDGREVLGAALLSLGHSPNSRDAAQIAAARDRVIAMKPQIANFDSSDFQTSLSTSQTVAAQGWNGQFAGAAAENPDLAFIVPKEGAFRYVDNWAIPKGAREKALAESFIDYLLRPDVAAKLVNLKRYASPNDAAKKLIDPAILAGMSYSEGDASKLHWVEALPDNIAKLYSDAWTAIKGE